MRRARRLARAVFADYRLNWVLRSPDAPAPALPPGLAVRRMTDADRATWWQDYQGADTFVLVQGGEPRAVARFVGAAAYRDAAIWPLPPGCQALVDIVTRADSRGRGLAPLLIAAATPMAGGRAICWIWWTHRASLRAFRRAGWRRIGFSAEVTTRSGRVWRWRVGLPGQGAMPKG